MGANAPGLFSLSVDGVSCTCTLTELSVARTPKEDTPPPSSAHRHIPNTTRHDATRHVFKSPTSPRWPRICGGAAPVAPSSSPPLPICPARWPSRVSCSVGAPSFLGRAMDGAVGTHTRACGHVCVCFVCVGVCAYGYCFILGGGETKEAEIASFALPCPTSRRRGHRGAGHGRAPPTSPLARVGTAADTVCA